MLPSSGATVEGDLPPGLIVATQMWTLCSYQPPAHVITCRLTLDNTQQAQALLLILTLSPSSSLPLPLSLQLYLSLSTSLSLPLSLYLLSLCIPFFAPLSLAIPALPVDLFTPGINMQLGGCAPISGQLSTGVNAPQMQRGSGLTARNTCGDGLAAYDRIL